MKGIFTSLREKSSEIFQDMPNFVFNSSNFDFYIIGEVFHIER